MADTIGLYNPANGRFFLRDELGAVTDFRFGPSGATGWQALTGDWNNDGIDTAGLYNPALGIVYLINDVVPTASTVVTSYRFGPSNAEGWQAIAGDWDGLNGDSVSLYNPATGMIYINNALAGGSVAGFRFGPSGADWQAIGGDWDNNSSDSVSLYDPSTGIIYINNTLASASVAGYRFGPSNATGWEAVAGDWDGANGDSVSLYNPSTGNFYINNTLAGGSVDGLRFGPSGATDWQPLSGTWSDPTPPAPTFEISTDNVKNQINEGSTLTFTVTLSAPAAVATEVTFQLKPGDVNAANAGTTNTNLTDFASGAASTFKATIAAGTTTQTFTVSPVNDGLTEFDEAFSVEATVGGVTKTLGATVRDGAISGGQTFILTAGADTIPGLIGSKGTTDNSGNDTITAEHTTFNAADQINGGAGTDTLNITDSGTGLGTLPAVLVSNVEVVNLRNVNGSAAVAATKEQVTLTFNDYTHAANSSITVGGTVLNLTANTTGSQIAQAFATTSLPAGYEFVSLNGAQLVLRATTAGNVADLTTSQTLGAASTMTAPTVAIAQGTNAVPSTGVTDTITATNFVGATEFNSNLSLNKVVVNALAAGQSAGMIGNGSLTNGDLDANYVAAATAATINIAGGTKVGTAPGTAAVTVSGTGLQTLTVNSTGAANTIGALAGAASTASTTIAATTDLTTGAVTNAGAKITVTGAGKVDLSTTALESAVKTIDASGNSGGLTAKLSDAVDIKVTGSTGNDVLTTNAILTTGTVDAGAGTDTLDIGTRLTDANTAALAAKYTNFETLRVNGTFDASLIAGITAIELSGATNNISKLTAAQAAAVTARADIGATTLALATDTGTADVLSLTMGTGTTTAAATNAGTLTINGFETLNVKTNAGPTATAGASKTTTISSFVADKLTAINLTGTAVTLSNAATTKAVTINASALTGDGAATPVGLTISGNLIAGSTVTGSGVKDTINLGTAGSTYNAGAGNDAFAATDVAQLRSGATYNTLNGGDGTDTLTITANSATMVDDDFKAISNIEKITIDADGGAGNVTITTGGWYDQNFKAAGSDLTILAANGDAVSFTGGTFSGAQKLTVTTAGDGASTADNVTVLTGSGADTVTVTATSWVGAAGAAGAINVNTGDGADTIAVTTGTLLAVTGTAAVSITGGKGADAITITHVNAASALGNAVFNVAAGDSGKAAFDSITGFKMSDVGGTDGKISDGLNFDAATIATTVAATAVSGFSAAELTYAINGTSGEVTFDGTKKADLTVTQVLDILDTVVANGKTVFWNTATTGGDTYVYNADAAGDSVVKLVGVNADALITTNDATTGNGVFIF